jgi:hypothetical protein
LLIDAVYIFEKIEHSLAQIQKNLHLLTLPWVEQIFCRTSDICLGFDSSAQNAITIKANSPVATFAQCRPYSSSLEIICKNGLHFAIRYPPLRFQAKLERVLYIV